LLGARLPPSACSRLIFIYDGGTIPALELPAPKAGSDYAEGWEHAEFATGEPLADFMARHPQVAFDTRAMGKVHNPEISLKIGGGYAIKFHPEPLLEVIRKEQKFSLS